MGQCPLPEARPPAPLFPLQPTPPESVPHRSEKLRSDSHEIEVISTTRGMNVPGFVKSGKGKHWSNISTRSLEQRIPQDHK